MRNIEALQKMRAEVKRAERQKRYYQNEIKRWKHLQSHYKRSARTHRLCTRGGMLESFLEKPEILTDEDVMELLKFIFQDRDIRKKRQQLIDQRKSEGRGTQWS